MDYNDAVRYLNEETTEGIEPDLSRITLLCEKLGNPEKAFRAIHITGTNGKTTTARMVDSVLTDAGFKSGYYTSPHLVSYTERFTANGRYITEKRFARLVEDIAPLIAEVNSTIENMITQFEALTAIAFTYFREENVDCAVVEVGMGGSWDATNLIDSDVAVITNVALEHTDRLGETITEIAKEKSGIIKRSASVVTAAGQQDVLDIIQERCEEQDARLYVAGRDFAVDIKKSDSGKGQIIDVRTIDKTYRNIDLALVGKHQATNAATAVVAAELFLKKNKPEALDGLGTAISTAISQVSSPGRLEVVGTRPLIVLDGAHNPAAAVRLRESLEGDFEYDRLILVLGMLGDKDTGGILDILIDKADTIIATQSTSYRAMSAKTLGEAIERRHRPVKVCGSVKDAIASARTSAGPEDMILITGSIYTIGEAKECLGNG